MLKGLIKRPIITEKSSLLAKRGVYSFEVLINASKKEIVKELKSLFNVDVSLIRTQILKGKVKSSLTNRRKTYRKSNVKKALVTLKKGQKISLFEVVEDKKKSKK